MLLLGSKSPRRKELLSGLNIDFKVVDIDCYETYPQNLRGADIVKYIAQLKALSYKDKLDVTEILLTADTIVWLDGKVLGKPHSEQDAKQMLKLLSGRTHEVYTGVCISTTEEHILFSDCTEVRFRELNDEEIDYYVDHYSPTDKAGAYGIQEWIGLSAVSSINGSYTNVMGLPTEKVYLYLRNFDLKK